MGTMLAIVMVMVIVLGLALVAVLVVWLITHVNKRSETLSYGNPDGLPDPLQLPPEGHMPPVPPYGQSAQQNGQRDTFPG